MPFGFELRMVSVMPRTPFEIAPEIAEIVARDWVHHPEPEVRERLLALQLAHLGRTREETAETLGSGRKTLQRRLASFRGRSNAASPARQRFTTSARNRSRPSNSNGFRMCRCMPRRALVERLARNG